MSAKRLSLCMIAKDEADWIDRTLSSVRGVVDEMIVVDTGSADATREIARSFGARVLDWAWTGSFADARNYGLAQASGDWILWLDADEEVDAANAHRLRDVLELEEAHLAAIELINYYGHSPPSAAHVYRLAHHRLFRNGIGLQFRNPIHEQLNVNDLDTPVNMQRLPVKVHHYGYMDAVTEHKRKLRRNLDMLLEAVADPGHDPWMDYHLAGEYFRMLEYEMAFRQVNLSIMLFLQKGITPPSMLYKLKYASLLARGSVDGAWPAIDKAIEMYPDYVDLHFYKGIILLHKGMPTEAVETFRHCLALGEDNLDYLTLKGVGSFQAWYYIGQCREKQGLRDQAKEAYQNALQLSSDHAEAREAYSRLQAEADRRPNEGKEVE